MGMGTVALIVRFDGDTPVLVEALSDDQEIQVLEQAFQKGDPDPLKTIHDQRKLRMAEDEKFGDYVEYLISQPCPKAEVLQHGLEWFYSRMRIEKYKQSETEAATVIANYALELFQDAPDRKEFILAGPKAKVQVKVYALDEALSQRAA